MDVISVILIIGLVYISLQQKKDSTRNMMLIITGLLAFCMFGKVEGYCTIPAQFLKSEKEYCDDLNYDPDADKGSPSGPGDPPPNLPNRCATGGNKEGGVSIDDFYRNLYWNTDHPLGPQTRDSAGWESMDLPGITSTADIATWAAFSDQFAELFDCPSNNTWAEWEDATKAACRDEEVNVIIGENVERCGEAPAAPTCAAIATPGQIGIRDRRVRLGDPGTRAGEWLHKTGTPGDRLNDPGCPITEEGGMCPIDCRDEGWTIKEGQVAPHCMSGPQGMGWRLESPAEQVVCVSDTAEIAKDQSCRRNEECTNKLDANNHCIVQASCIKSGGEASGLCGMPSPVNVGSQCSSDGGSNYDGQCDGAGKCCLLNAAGDRVCEPVVPTGSESCTVLTSLVGYSVQNPDATTVSGLGNVTCAEGYVEVQPGIVPLAHCSPDSNLVLSGCVLPAAPPRADAIPCADDQVCENQAGVEESGGCKIHGLCKFATTADRVAGNGTCAPITNQGLGTQCTIGGGTVPNGECDNNGVCEPLSYNCPDVDDEECGLGWKAISTDASCVGPGGCSIGADGATWAQASGTATGEWPYGADHETCCESYQPTQLKCNNYNGPNTAITNEQCVAKFGAGSTTKDMRDQANAEQIIHHLPEGEKDFHNCCTSATDDPGTDAPSPPTANTCASEITDCGTGKRHKEILLNTPCPSGGCTSTGPDSCCEQIPTGNAMCSSLMTCSSGHELIENAAETECAGTECKAADEETCCKLSDHCMCGRDENNCPIDTVGHGSCHDGQGSGDSNSYGLGQGYDPGEHSEVWQMRDPNSQSLCTDFDCAVDEMIHCDRGEVDGFNWFGLYGDYLKPGEANPGNLFGEDWAWYGYCTRPTDSEPCPPIDYDTPKCYPNNALCSTLTCPDDTGGLIDHPEQKVCRGKKCTDEDARICCKPK